MKNVKVLLWQEFDMVSAGAAVQEKKLSQRAAAKEFSVPRFTLYHARAKNNENDEHQKHPCKA